MSSAQLVAQNICSPPVVTRMDGSELVRAPARAEFDRLLNILASCCWWWSVSLAQFTGRIVVFYAYLWWAGRTRPVRDSPLERATQETVREEESNKVHAPWIPRHTLAESSPSQTINYGMLAGWLAGTASLLLHVIKCSTLHIFQFFVFEVSSRAPHFRAPHFGSWKDHLVRGLPWKVGFRNRAQGEKKNTSKNALGNMHEMSKCGQKSECESWRT